MRGALTASMVLVLGLGCGSGPVEEPAPRTQLSDGPSLALEEVTWPAFPPAMRPSVEACVTEYRELAVSGLPPQRAGQEFREWYTGPFDRWVQSYNSVRERCDAVTEQLEEGGAESQVLLGVTSFLHERLGEEMAPYDSEPQMHVMGRYWTLGASCTYDSCAEGPEEEWAAFCRDRDRMMPPCPPVTADPASVSSPPPDAPAEAAPAEATPASDEDPAAEDPATEAPAR